MDSQLFYAAGCLEKVFFRCNLCVLEVSLVDFSLEDEKIFQNFNWVLSSRRQTPQIYKFECFQNKIQLKFRFLSLNCLLNDLT